MLSMQYPCKQKKRTINSLASPVTQGQRTFDHSLLADWMLLMKKYNRQRSEIQDKGQDPSKIIFYLVNLKQVAKNTIQNVKLFSRYLAKSKGMPCFGVRKTAQIQLWVMQICYFFQTMRFFWPKVHGIKSWGFFNSNVLEMISYQNIKWHETANQISETMSGENCQRFRISQFSWVNMHSNILNCGKTVRNVWIGSFACYHQEYCQDDVWTQLC